ncbi:MAG: Holliday junction branch migration protein RuvA, partial [Alphaproteobacteria bacterium]|nr:Holliday junction branch migration protein RuvA [Alphaproteobacteria bacterium]
IGDQDKTSFCRASGVGPKLAARIITELKDKIVTIPLGAADLNETLADSDDTQEKVTIQPTADTSADYAKTEDAISALVNLGYQRLEAYRVVSKVAMDNPDADTSSLIRSSLKEFAKKEF